ncbi:uncharacterized protein MONOS_6480 [Monocercomonoides exilis]|uniref:uncharacterized protein n=1 Tax=Monocercomonoides exilis TaxID=2049356 RepID=UPI003559DB44|nr:hypothetical protein MONOS_6480 [Monocercomonoides exilis]|eukprot:MONOS_6480.1-p1 / transcript=MONOS_6480.1 / gene=MONOS_6480 / organism=Monocercomonoides_exilis_PA203 / gene_product=unspecified product / transcript_product=unspecified product / location=Mono_scaffold00204:76815-77390(-) / protein_length=115 / sequence_SO=supercontig / SO=protein_coding / is_pseudo=false
MKLLVRKKAEAAQKRLKEAMYTLHCGKYETRLERIAHIVNDNVVRLVDGMDNMFNDSEEEGENEKKIKKTVTLKEVYAFILRHPESMSSLPKQVDINRFATSCHKVLKQWFAKL